MGILVGISVAVIFASMIVAILLYYSRKVWIGSLLLYLTNLLAWYDSIPESYATIYQSGGGFNGLANSYKGFGPVRAPGDLDWAIRRVGEKETWPAYTDAQGTEHPPEEHVYTEKDFYPDRRTPLIRNIFGPESGVVYMGPWPGTGPHFYELRINNFRTVRPGEDEIKQKKASIRPYYAFDAKGTQQPSGWLISWNERTCRVLLSDDVIPIPVDGIRIGTKILSQDGKKQAVLANILVFVRQRIREPYLYSFRAEDAPETIQNSMIQHIRELCAGMSVQEVYALKASLEADKPEQKSPILDANGFGVYMRTRYGVQLKDASFGIIEVVGEAGQALTAPFVAEQLADAEAARGDGEGRAEYNRMIREGDAVKQLVITIGAERTTMLREADVATRFADSAKGTNTVLLGLDGVLGALGKLAAGAPLPQLPAPPKPNEEKEEKDVRSEPQQPKQ